jgi:hypothetical protein
MKSFFLNLILAGSLSIIILPGCNSPVEKAVAAKEKPPKVKANVVEANIELEQSLEDSMAKVQGDSLASWEKFEKESEKKIHTNDKNLAKFKASINTEHKYMKEDYQKAYNYLDHKNENLKDRLAEFAVNRNEPLNTFKQRFDNDITEVAKSLENLK